MKVPSLTCLTNLHKSNDVYLLCAKADGLAKAKCALDDPCSGLPVAHNGGGGDVVVELGPVVVPGDAVQHLRGREGGGLHVLGGCCGGCYTQGKQT